MTMSEEKGQIDYIESRLREACDRLATFRNLHKGTDMEPLADGLILMADSLRLLAIQVDRLRPKSD
jgi:hypothetical protein